VGFFERCDRAGDLRVLLRDGPRAHRVRGHARGPAGERRCAQGVAGGV